MAHAAIFVVEIRYVRFPAADSRCSMREARTVPVRGGRRLVHYCESGGRGVT